MSLIVKTATPVPEGDIMRIEERLTKGTTIYLGEEVFIWTAETAGGEGLARRGEIIGVSYASREHDRVMIIVELDARPVRRPFTKADLARRDYRGSDRPRADDAEERLAEKLYVHSLNRCVTLAEDEAAYLNRFFE